MARTPKAAGKRLIEKIVVSLTVGDRALVEAAAKREGLELTAWARGLMLKAAIGASIGSSGSCRPRPRNHRPEASTAAQPNPPSHKRVRRASIRQRAATSTARAANRRGR